MLERYFVKPQTLDRIHACWLSDPIERYVAWLAEQGYAESSIRRRVPLLMQFATFAETHGATTWDELPPQVMPFVQHRAAAHRQAGHSEPRCQQVIKEVRPPVDQLLRLLLDHYQGYCRYPEAPTPFLEQAPGFFPYLQEERGLRERTCQTYAHFLRRFEAYLERTGQPELDALTPAVLSAFVVESGATLGPKSMTGLCGILRVFLRYLHREQRLPRDLSGAVELPQHYRLADIPRSISGEDVGRLLAAVDRRSAVGKRDFALLLLLVTYGLRGCEVAALTLDDIDWQRERLRIPQRKAGHCTAYPLSSAVGEAIVDYLQHGRPPSDDRHVFLRVMAPSQPLTDHSISHRVIHHLRQAGIEVHRPGSHTLRHSCVQRLIDANFTLKTIGDYVGHSTPSSTEIYTKVALEALREVALGDGEVL